MDPSRRVWKWTGAVLVVACAALIILRVLLTPHEPGEPALDAHPTAMVSLEPPGHDSFRLIPSDQSESAAAARAPEAPENDPTPDSRFGFSKPQGRIEPDQHQPSRPGGEPPQTKFLASGSPTQASSPVANDNRQSSIIDSFRPLGIVEKSGGRVQAVIQDGEWTRLVEAGEILADNSRVLSVSAEGVEILRPQGKPDVVMAEARVAIPRKVNTGTAQATTDLRPRESESEWGSAAVRAKSPGPPAAPRRLTSDLPGLESGVASYTAPPSKRPAQFEPPAATALPSLSKDANAQPLEEVAAARQGVLGTVAYPNGRVEIVIADGQWVNLVPGPSPLAESADSSKGQPIGSLPQPAIASPSSGNGTKSENSGSGDALGAPPTGSERLVTLPPSEGKIQNPESLLQNLVEPIGIVEWTSGRAQAVVVNGDSISFVEGGEALAHTRRLLALMPPPTGSTDDMALDLAGPPARTREEDAAWLVIAGGGDESRAPPDEVAMPLPEPAEIARGQPDDEAFADSSRPPPAFDSGESGLWIEGLPGIEATPAGKIELSQLIERHSTAVLSDSEDAPAGSVSENHVEEAVTPRAILAVERNRSKDMSASPQFAAQAAEERVLTLLGFVRWPDGRARAVVLFADSVILVSEGETLADGSLVKNVRPDGVVVATPEAAGITQGGLGAGHLELLGPHQTPNQPSGAGLQSGSPLRDNRERSRR